ncbi:tumor necrosis factor receptor superfamily member 4-like [Sceloporus undulatus]|uniref:tumor necrosis factor receptor superfamily member 4-like n=1 Tax=Sceloporus undulatus TaxID=8520 RepID=UPI001C4CD8EE|nr:tumor necrosis factor receptor superfamily member 4-like [Sceloporus undulatus]
MCSRRWQSMKPILGFVGFTCLVPIVWGTRCSEFEYPLGTKCCKMCPPGSELKQRCDHSRETACEPCEEDYYNDSYTYSRCRSCTVCEKDRGLQEVKPCEAHSDAHCTCLPGYSETVTSDEKSEYGIWMKGKSGDGHLHNVLYWALYICCG